MRRTISIYWYNRTVKRIPPIYHYVLSEYNHYYRNLNPELQFRFRKRVYITNKYIEYVPHDFPSVSIEMAIIIASALIQITFGLQNYSFTRFNTIYIVPYNTYNFAQFPNLYGHVDYAADIITLSWPSVKNGFIIPDDSFNVALHEVAHAIQEENKMKKWSTDFFSSHDLKEWEKQALKKFAIINAKEHKFLKTYGGTNMLEMFAVCVETFFEQPVEFKDKLSELYSTLIKLFKQDPSRLGNPLL